MKYMSNEFYEEFWSFLEGSITRDQYDSVMSRVDASVGTYLHYKSASSDVAPHICSRSVCEVSSMLAVLVKLVDFQLSAYALEGLDGLEAYVFSSYSEAKEKYLLECNIC